ncbi:NAC domain-containing protein 104-like [Magnolia sinica]|uniref:NAC domain-containing protein 104-like n=1 Tax=Magnolia sinica TaxID=86752 RepID=UPI00265ACF05|nr:NAC domain-containing protein 104-like [Magnolia sinica]
MGEYRINLPPGFRFYPTDEELVVYFLRRKAAHLPFHPDVIPDVDLGRYDPSELSGKALEANNQWYFFSQMTQNRVSSNGYWKTVGYDEPITSGSKTVGMKKSLVFYVGESPTGMKTNWAMHEYQLLECGTSTSSRSSKRRGKPKIAWNEWVLCRVYENNCGSQSGICDDGTETDLSSLDEVFLSLDDLDEISLPN